MKTPEEILKENGFSRMTVIYDKYGNQMDGDTIIEMMQEYAKEYVLSLLPSDEEIEEELYKPAITHFQSGKNVGYVRGKKYIKQQILNKLNT